MMSSASLGDAETVAAFVRRVISAAGRRAVVTVDRGPSGNEVRVSPPGHPGDTPDAETISILALAPGDAEIAVRDHCIELGAGDLGDHQPLNDPVEVIRAAVLATVNGTLSWDSTIRRRHREARVPLAEWISFPTDRGDFRIYTHFGHGGFGRVVKCSGRAAAYPQRLCAGGR